MHDDRLVAGCLVRVAIRRNRWHITLHDPTTGEVESFASFEALGARLEQLSSERARPPGTPPERT